ncbi:hypothetical protein D3C73_675860 [compost metagenome]
MQHLIDIDRGLECLADRQIRGQAVVDIQIERIGRAGIDRRLVGKFRIVTEETGIIAWNALDDLHLAGRKRATAHSRFRQEAIDHLIQIGRPLMIGIFRGPVIMRVPNEADFLALDVAIKNERTGTGDFRPTRLQLR